MSQTVSSPLQRAVDVVEALPLEDQETLIELLQRRLAERRREEIARQAAATLQAVREGRARYGSVPSAVLRAGPSTALRTGPSAVLGAGEGLKHDLLAES